MPKIVIREIDDTKAGGGAYANFSVVVPGFVADQTTDWEPDLSKFDENGVYECDNRSDFKAAVGLVNSTAHRSIAAVAPVRATGWTEPRELTSTEFTTYMDQAQGILCTVIPNNIGAEPGERVDSQYLYTVATSTGEYNFVSPPDPSPNVPDGEEPGESAGDEPVAPANEEPVVEYTQFMLLTNLGSNASYEQHYGNQIAYELLGMGYTILYKKINKIADLSDFNFWEPLRDKSIYDFRYIISGLLNGNTNVYEHMIGLAELKPETVNFDSVGATTHGRGDCIALLDIDESTYKSSATGKGYSQKTAIESVLSYAAEHVPSSKYATAFLPSVNYAEASLSEVASFGNNKTFPASFHYLACASRSSEHYNEWYANAGYTRGISNYTIESVNCNFGEAAVNMFQKRAKDPDKNVLRAINPIINLRGSYYIWGNRTTFDLGDKDKTDGDLKASHFLNIRQLCSTLKKKVYVTCRQLTFDPNSEILWINFCNAIKPLLEKMKTDQGIADYKLSKTKTTHKAFLAVKIRIVPIEAVEDFDISVYLEDSLNGIIATADEE